MTKFVRLTDPSGQPAWISAEFHLRDPLPNEFKRTIRCVISADWGQCGVEETPEEVMRKLDSI